MKSKTKQYKKQLKQWMREQLDKMNQRYIQYTLDEWAERGTRRDQLELEPDEK